MIKNTIHLFAVLIAVLFSSCSGTSDIGSKPSILATTGMLADITIQIVGDSAEVNVLMPAGTDPHSYKATQNDLTLLNDADVVIYNGLHLEAKMHEVLEQLEEQGKPTVSAERAIPKDQVRKLDAHGSDPHVWLSVPLWKGVATEIYNKLVALHPENKDFYESNYNSYVEKMDAVDVEIRENIALIDSNKRVIITSHDALGYFGAEYGLEVKGIKGFSTTSETSIKYAQELVEFIVEKDIHTIFPESSTSDKDLKRILEVCEERNHELKLGEELYTDSMGEEGSDAGTYLGMLRSNAETLKNALK